MTEREADRLRRLDEFQDRIGYVFSERKWLEEALTHSSYSHEHGLDYWNERLEFLGDAVLELIVTEQLFREHPQEREGHLTQIRSSQVREEVLTAWGRSIGLDALLLAGKGARRSISENMTGDAVEALIGAIYLDGGMDAARAFVDSRPKGESSKPLDAKSALQIYLQGKGLPAPKYELVSRSGFDHEPVFSVRAWYGVGKSTEGAGASRKAAEQSAAQAALDAIASEA